MTLSEPGDCWIYECDDIVIEPGAHRLERGGHPVLVEPKAYIVLVALLEQAGDVVGKNELLDTAWGHRNVTPGVLNRVISQLRHALGDSAQHPHYILTVHSLGYRFIGEVHRQAAHAAVPTTPAPEVAPTDTTPAPSAPAQLPGPNGDPPRRARAAFWLRHFLSRFFLLLMLSFVPGRSVAAVTPGAGPSPTACAATTPLIAAFAGLPPLAQPCRLQSRRMMPPAVR